MPQQVDPETKPGNGKKKTPETLQASDDIQRCIRINHKTSGTLNHHKHLIAAVKHGGGRTMILALLFLLLLFVFAATEPARLTSTEPTMTFSANQSILEANMKLSVQQLVGSRNRTTIPQDLLKNV